MNQTYPQEYKSNIKDLASKKPRTYSENMTKLRRPFLCNENFSNPQNSKNNKEQLRRKDNKVKENLNTLGHTKDFKQISSESEYFTSTNSGQEKENWFSIENNLEKPKQKKRKYSCEEYAMHRCFNEEDCSRIAVKDKNNDDSAFENNLNKRFGIEESATELETSEISDYFTDESEYTTNYFLKGDISTENLSFVESLQPLKNSTFILQGETQANETFLFEGKCHNRELFKTKTGENHQKNIIQQVPLIAINEKILTTNFDYEENKKLKAKIIQMELFKQIETKDKVMNQLLELSKSSEFPKLKHFCTRECEKDTDGICKKIKCLLDNAGAENNGVFQYIWSVITYPFATASPIAQEKNEGIIKIFKPNEEETRSATQGANQRENQKETFLYENGKQFNAKQDIEKSPSMQSLNEEFHRITEKAEKKSKPQKSSFYFFQKAEKSENDKDEEEKCFNDSLKNAKVPESRVDTLNEIKRKDYDIL